MSHMEDSAAKRVRPRLRSLALSTSTINHIAQKMASAPVVGWTMRSISRMDIVYTSTNVVLCGHESSLLVNKLARDPGSQFCKCKILLRLAHKHKTCRRAGICVLCGHESSLLVNKLARDPGSQFCKCKILLRLAH